MSLLLIIFVEALIRMVLLIPNAIKALKDEGRKEGREEERQRLQRVFDRHGVAVEENGVRKIYVDAEFLASLIENGDSGKG